MRRITGGRKPSPSMLVAIAALVMAVTGSAIALPGRNSVDSGDIKAEAVKRGDQLKNQRTDYAVVAPDGAIIAQSGGISQINDDGPGNYHLRFPANLGKRPITANIHAEGGNNGLVAVTRCGTSPPGGANCSFGNNQRHVYVNTREDNGAPNDEKFIVTVLPR